MPRYAPPMLRERLATLVRTVRPRRRAVAFASSGAAVLAIAGAGTFMLVAGSPAPAKRPAAAATTTTAAPHLVARPKPAPRHPRRPKVHLPPTCPLTGLAPPGGQVPQREVLAVKVGNNPSARPQSGLQQADIVFDTLAEGGITRYIAVYQCGTAADIGPVRSVRWDDWHILAEFGHAGLAYVGGVNPNRATVASLPWICNLDDFVHPELYQQDPERVPPDATYTSTAVLSSACGKQPPPPPAFQFSKSVQPGAGPVSAAEIPYSGSADVVWQWSAAQHAFLHAYREGGAVVPDIDSDASQLQADNVLVQFVAIQYGPYIETPGSTGDVESITLGSGPAYLLRNGRLIKGTWSRAHWDDMTQFTTAGGKPFLFDPGNTWVELVPLGLQVTFTP